MKIITYSLIASQTIAPLSSKEFIQDIDSQLIAFWGKEVSRVYCSSKSLGFDLHFNNKSGELYSLNEFSNKLEPFRIESEIPFKDIIPKKDLDYFLSEFRYIKIDTNIRKDDLLIKMYSRLRPEEYIIASLNLKNLKLKFDTTNLWYLTAEEQIIIESIANELKCEYIEPESYKL